MEEIVRPALPAERSQGYRTPPAKGLNESRPLISIGDQGGQTDTSPYARVDEPEDYGWWPRLKILLAGGAEVTSVWKDVSSSFEIDPNACLIWRLNCQSQSLALTFAALQTPSWINRLLIWKQVTRTVTVQIIINWLADSGTVRTVTLGGVKFPGRAIPDWTATTGYDVVTVQITSDGEKYGFTSGLDMGVPS